MEKSILRKKILAELNKMSHADHKGKSRKIIESLMMDPAYKKADVVGVTISAFPEVETAELIQAIWTAGKQAVVPKCLPVSRNMDFYKIDDFSQLEVAYMHLREPKTETAQYIPPDKIDLLVVPGVVFSKEGYRIGFGGGYYDRYLEGYKGETRSLAFSCQLVDSIPVESHDIPVSGIYTENGFIDTKRVAK